MNYFKSLGIIFVIFFGVTFSDINARFSQNSRRSISITAGSDINPVSPPIQAPATDPQSMDNSQIYDVNKIESYLASLSDERPIDPNPDFPGFHSTLSPREKARRALLRFPPNGGSGYNVVIENGVARRFYI